MAEDPTSNPAPEQAEPPTDPAELSTEDLKKVSGGASDLFRQSAQTGWKSPGAGVGSSAPVDPPEPLPAIKISHG